MLILGHQFVFVCPGLSPLVNCARNNSVVIHRLAVFCFLKGHLLLTRSDIAGSLVLVGMKLHWMWGGNTYVLICQGSRNVNTAEGWLQTTTRRNLTLPLPRLQPKDHFTWGRRVRTSMRSSNRYRDQVRAERGLNECDSRWSRVTHLGRENMEGRNCNNEIFIFVKNSNTAGSDGQLDE